MEKVFDLQPELENELVKIRPLKQEDFEALFAVASDPLIWEQHPEKDRYKKEVFRRFFDGAMESKGAFLVFDNQTAKPIGSSRFYQLDNEPGIVLIGYTFIERAYWGTQTNKSLKSLMLEYVFRFRDQVIFQIGAGNIRSQKAVEKLGAIKTEEKEIHDPTGKTVKHYVYRLFKGKCNLTL